LAGDSASISLLQVVGAGTELSGGWCECWSDAICFSRSAGESRIRL
jgi:hypothetical protein